jgi:hypothetical protein
MIIDILNFHDIFYSVMRTRKRYNDTHDYLPVNSFNELKSLKRVELPKIKKKKMTFMDDISISDDYIKISGEKE